MKRQLVKQEAKNCLKENWKNAIIVLIMLAVIPQIVSLVTNFITGYLVGAGILVSSDWLSLMTSVMENGYIVKGAIKGAMIGSAIGTISLVVTIVLYMFTLSKIGFFFRITDGEKPTVKEFFQTGRYLESIKIELYVAVRLFLWALIGIIPMIIGFLLTIFVNTSASILFLLGTFVMAVLILIKSLSYYMAVYLKYKNPDKTCGECVKESVKLMNGYKGQLFVLFLSFIGWYLLLALGLGVLGLIQQHGGEPGYYIGAILSAIGSLIGEAAIGAYLLSSTIIFYKEMTNPYLEQKYFYGTGAQMSGMSGAAYPSGSNGGSAFSDKSTLEKTEGIAVNDETSAKEQTEETVTPADEALEKEEIEAPTASIDDKDKEN